MNFSVEKYFALDDPHAYSLLSRSIKNTCLDNELSIFRYRLYFITQIYLCVFGCSLISNLMFGGHLGACIIFLKTLSRYSICRDYSYRRNKPREGLVCISDYFNRLSPRQNGEHCADGIFKCIYSNGSFHFFIHISLKFIPNGQIHDMSASI